MGGMVMLTDPRHVVFGIDAEDFKSVNVDMQTAQLLNRSINESMRVTQFFTKDGAMGVALESPEEVIGQINYFRQDNPVQRVSSNDAHFEEQPQDDRAAAPANSEDGLLQGVKADTRKDLENEQQIYVLHKQRKAIDKKLKELGEDDGDDDNERLARLLEEAQLPPETKKEADREFSRLKKMQPMSQEASVSRTWLETIASIPWNKLTATDNNLDHAQKILDEDHYGLDKVKDRILDHLAVMNQPNASGSGKILCLIGPPGVGKTSIAMSIAHATNRELQSIAVGGVKDESEIRGHRRTYVGALPGTIIQALKKAQTRNPLFVIDEIDKMGSDSTHGDPAAAMLEVLDPKQNFKFMDHYVDQPVDLSKADFICTANDESTIPAALADRMDIIRLPGYTREQKFEIGKRFLVGKQMKAAGLDSNQFEFTDAGLRKLIGDYTREAGVRNLERLIETVCAKAVRAIQKDSSKKVSVGAEDLKGILGAPRVSEESIPEEDSVGIVNGLAWSAAGGSTLQIEAKVMPGKDFALVSTGNLKEVMKESVIVAHSVAESLYPALAEKFNAAAGKTEKDGLDPKKLENCSVHLHVLSGAIPKDGPSAGAALTTAMLSALLGVKVRRDVAMTGEISLNGKVMPIGGLPEKLDGALRDGATTVLIPKANVRDLDDVPEEIKSKLHIEPVSTIDQVLEWAFVKATTGAAAPAPANMNTITAAALRQPSSQPA